MSVGWGDGKQIRKGELNVYNTSDNSDHHHNHSAVVPLTEPAKRDNATSPSVLCIKLTPENTETLFKLCEEGNCLLQDYLSNLCNREIAMIRFTQVATEGSRPYNKDQDYMDGYYSPRFPNPNQSTI